MKSGCPMGLGKKRTEEGKCDGDQLGRDGGLSTRVPLGSNMALATIGLPSDIRQRDRKPQMSQNAAVPPGATFARTGFAHASSRLTFG